MVLLDGKACSLFFPSQSSVLFSGGSRFHPDVILMDPYAKHVASVKAPEGTENIFLGSLSSLTAPRFNWEDVPRPRYGFEQLVVSELDLTVLSKSRPALETATGMQSFRCCLNVLALLEAIAKMSAAGVNGVVLRGAMLSGTSATNNCTPLSFFAPNSQIFSDNPSHASTELKTLIQDCHRRSMEVLLEVGI